MSAIRGTIRNGKVEFDVPPEWPEGTEVRVGLVDPFPDDEDDSPDAIAGRRARMNEYVGVGMREEDWPTDEAGIEALIVRMDQIQPFLTPDEEAEWHKARAEQKAWEIANWDKHCKKIEDLFK